LAYHDLRGTNASAQRKQLIVSDIRPSAGYMHSGYPIMTHLDVTIPTNKFFNFNYTHMTSNIAQGFWGQYH
jgi:hypothetical protein